MSKDKYRIKIETINGNDEELRAEYRMGLDCEGFAIIGDYEDSAGVSIHKMSTMDIAHAIAVSDDLMQAAYIAIGIDMAKRSHEDRHMKAAALKIDLGDIARGFGRGGGDD